MGADVLSHQREYIKVWKKEVSERKRMKYKNHGKESYFNRGIQYVDSANYKLMKLPEFCKSPENKFYYITALELRVCLSSVL